MSFNGALNTLAEMNKIKKLIAYKLYSRFRILKYWMLSSCTKVQGNPIKNGPVLMNGLGTIFFGKDVNLGYEDSPFFFNSYIYIEARKKHSQIKINAGVYINNNACIICEGQEGIEIGSNTLIGTSLTIYDSDFHELNPLKRSTGTPTTAGVFIGENVFLGSNVTILKGVHIGNNSIIGSGSVVSSSIPENVIAGGNPCKVIRSLKV